MRRCARLIAAGLLAMTAATTTIVATAQPPADPPLLYWGAHIDGDVYGRGDAPWDRTTWNRFEGHAGKRVSLVQFRGAAPWVSAFTRTPLDMIRARGAIGYMSMSSDAVSLASIASGLYDRSLIAWARAARRYGRPFFLRWNWEMNGTWYDWGAQARANPSVFVAAWRHFHDVVRRHGATNVTWVWCPNVVFEGSTPLDRLYPGGAYVDWTCADVYNFGTLQSKTDRWRTFAAIMRPTYRQLLALAPRKPILLGEIASTEHGGSKSRWITDLLEVQLPANFPMVRAFVWFNWNIVQDGRRYDWQIESSARARSAFASAVAQPRYASNDYGRLPRLRKVPLP